MREAAEKAQQKDATSKFTYDDACLEKMVHHFSSYDDLLKYVKRYGMHRHFE